MAFVIEKATDIRVSNTSNQLLDALVVLFAYPENVVRQGVPIEKAILSVIVVVSIHRDGNVEKVGILV